MPLPKRKAPGAAKATDGARAKMQQLGSFADAGAPALTTNLGAQVPDNHNSLHAGVRGPSLMEDFILREKLAHFSHERIAERVTNARGSGAHGFFRPFKSMAPYTKAFFLQDPDVQTPVFVRFSSMLGSSGSADTVRDVRGFAVKFYTGEGNYDLVGTNVPVSYVQDAMKFPDLMHALKPEPHHGMPQASSAHDTFWDFASLMPEATHMLMWAMSDRTLPRSYRMMEGFGVHAFRFINSGGDSHFVKFHWKPRLGLHSLDCDEAQKLAGRDPDFHRRDLWEAIDSGQFPEWDLGVQIVDEGKESELGFDILDPTKLIPESQVPVQLIGRLTLNRNPDNFFAETEQVAFNPGHLVPGIDFSNDPLLQGRLMAYADAQRSRLGGTNSHEIPINRAVCPMHNFQRDGQGRHAIAKGRVAYEPNTLATGTEFRADGGAQGFQSWPEPLEGHKVRGRSPSFDDHFTQAGLFWNSQSTFEKDHIVNAFRLELSKVETAAVRQRVVDNLAQVDQKLATRVAAPLGINPPDLKAAAGRLGFRDHRGTSKVEEDAALRMQGRPEAGIKTRRIAVLVADGVEPATIRRIQQDLVDAGAVCKVISTSLGSASTASGRQMQIDGTFSANSSVLFDAVLIPGGQPCIDALGASGQAVHFVLEAYKHCKPICAVNEGVQLMSTLGFVAGKNPEAITRPAAGIVLGDARRVPEGMLSQEFIAAIAQHRHWERANIDAVPA
jgi:catalase